MSTFAAHAAAILRRDLSALHREVDAYPDDASVWAEVPGLPNAAGTLVLHLCGNLRHFIGARLGHTGYVRDREREFSARNLSREVLRAEIADAEAAVHRGLSSLADDALAAPFPDTLANHTYATGDFLLHLCSHFAYHLGQIDYHRRVVTGQNVSVGTMALPALHSATAVG
jgi:uncharacterized damage-inducible protein DinB